MLAQCLGPFVSEHVEGSEDGLSGLLTDAGFVVEDPGHRGLTDPGLPGDVRESKPHDDSVAYLKFGNSLVARVSCF
ncbi:hypothetical protein GCM10009782_06890 [Glycomyces algeriensis]